MTTPATEAYVDNTTEAANENIWTEYSPPSKNSQRVFLPILNTLWIARQMQKRRKKAI
ncbi:MAG: hypothetical protein HWD61_02210 [Parachlamydiaceae bacterium]|nr:MAG: hypothetical protein HWD61_02210 [Parachlamydiaceae bacterium]